MSGRLKALSLFSGVGMFDLALRNAGVDVVAACEKDPAARAVLRYLFPDIPIFTDVTELTADVLAAHGITHIDLVIGGWPCQDLSVAGHRLGLGGARSGLWWELHRLLAELRPRWFIGENVPGLLSAVCCCTGVGECALADGRAVRPCPGTQHTVRGGTCPGGCIAVHGGALGAVLGSVADLGYGYAYRVLDAQFFGVPQRRRRLFLVGYLGADHGAAARVLLEPEGSAGHPAPLVEAWADLAPSAAEGPRDAGRGLSIVGSLTTKDRNDAETAGGGCTSRLRLAGALMSRRGGPDDNAAQAGHIVVGALTTKERDYETWVEDDKTNTLNTFDTFDTFDTGDSRAVELVQEETVVRRLTPREKERLQGLPDDWTRYRINEKTGLPMEQKDSPRSHQIGNGGAVPVVEWIASRLLAVEAGLL